MRCIFLGLMAMAIMVAMLMVMAVPAFATKFQLGHPQLGSCGSKGGTTFNANFHTFPAWSTGSDPSVKGYNDHLCPNS